VSQIGIVADVERSKFGVRPHSGTGKQSRLFPPNETLASSPILNESGHLLVLSPITLYGLAHNGWETIQ